MMNEGRMNSNKDVGIMQRIVKGCFNKSQVQQREDETKDLIGINERNLDSALIMIVPYMQIRQAELAYLLTNMLYIHCTVHDLMNGNRCIPWTDLQNKLHLH